MTLEISVVYRCVYGRSMQSIYVVDKVDVIHINGIYTVQVAKYHGHVK